MYLPFWGDDTFKDLNGMDDCPVTTVSVKDFMSRYGSSDTSLLGVCRTLVNTGFLLYLDGTNYTWCSDIRFNYRDRIIYAPVLSYDVLEHDTKNKTTSPYVYWVEEGCAYIRYDYANTVHTLFDLEDWNILDADVLCLFDTVTKTIIELDLSECTSVFPELDNEWKLLDNIVELYDTFVNVKSTRPKDRYMRIEPKKKKSFDILARGRLNLPLWGGKTKGLKYNDLRLKVDRETIPYSDYLELRTELESSIMWLMGVPNRVRDSVIEKGYCAFGDTNKLYLKWYYGSRVLYTKRARTTDMFITKDDIDLIYN